jgi:hypothetical protein
MEMGQRVLLTIGVVVVLMAGFFLITNAITKYTGFSITAEIEEDSFKSCLKEKGILLYVNTNDLSETLGDLELIDHLADVEITNCLRNNQVCLDDGVSSFPAWVSGDNLAYGDITIDELSELSGCSLII